MYVKKKKIIKIVCLCKIFKLTYKLEKNKDFEMYHHLLCNFMYCTSKIYSYYNKHHQKIPENYSNLLMNNINYILWHPM